MRSTGRLVSFGREKSRPDDILKPESRTIDSVTQDKIPPLFSRKITLGPRPNETTTLYPRGGIISS